MARSAKRYLVNNKKDESRKTVAKVGIYARLSVDTDGNKANTLENQAALICDFIQKSNDNPKQNTEFVIYDIYKDLGKTGTNFERPEFERLMRDIKSKEVNCVIVKDFSRFGRNYIETGDFIEKIFPFLQVRFISVNDNYDSMGNDAKGKELTMNVKNLVNEMYAKDISKKEKVSKRTEQEAGSYVGSVAPFGYRIEKQGRLHILIVEPEEARIVQYIFEAYVSGKTINTISRELFERKIHRISDYRQYGHLIQQEDELLHQWGSSSIRVILERHNYYGDLVQHKYESRFAKGEKWCELMPSEEWIVTENAHEPIISKILFEKAQKRLQMDKDKRAKVLENANHLMERTFYNVMYCGECCRRLIGGRDKERCDYYCGASSRYKDERRCTPKSISEEKLQVIVHHAIRQVLLQSNMKGRDLTAMNEKAAESRRIQFQKELELLKKENRNWAQEMSDAYEEYKEGHLAFEQYELLRKERTEQENFRIERSSDIEKKLKQLEIDVKKENQFLRSLLKAEQTYRLNAEVVESLIDKILLYKGGRLEIRFKIADPIHQKEGSYGTK